MSLQWKRILFAALLAGLTVLAASAVAADDLNGNWHFTLHTEGGDREFAATFKVDGTTFADKQVGDVFSTGWGQIKVLAIDAVAQKVTFMHGDATFTLHVGEWIIK